jgi:hypothetical protein
MFFPRLPQVLLLLLSGVLVGSAVFGERSMDKKESPAIEKAKPRVRVNASPTFIPANYGCIAVFVQNDKRQPFAYYSREKFYELFGSYQYFSLRAIEDEFILALTTKGYNVPSRTDVPSLMKELGLQNSGITDSDISQIGKFINAQGILLVTIGTSDQSISARLLSVESSEVLWLASAVVGARWGECARELASYLPVLSESGSCKVAGKRCAQSTRFSEVAVNRVAVILLPSNFLSPTQIEDVLFGSLMSKGYSVPSRQDMESVVGEQKFQNMGLTEGTSAEFGKLLNVQAVLVVGLDFITDARPAEGKVTRSFGFGARLIEVETGRLLWVGCNEGSVGIERAKYETDERMSLLLPNKDKEVVSIENFLDVAESLGGMVPAKVVKK